VIAQFRFYIKILQEVNC